MAAPPSTVVVALLFLLCTTSIPNRAPLSMVEATWCVVRSDASEQAMLAGLNFACAAGADCAAIQSSGLCYLPNTIQAHASFAYNSYYQRRGSDPASCYFFGTATIAKTDPSYGSCVYPSSPSTEGGSVAPGGTSVPGTTPATGVTQPPPPGTTTAPLYGGGGITPEIGSTDPDSPKSNASPDLLIRVILFPVCFFILSFTFQTM
ncbi:major pollen allergen Ole e 10-like isoform X2 [Olea europaea var. sylvestris]|uniref:major pollen allergen Ole e 10-like isoform X2 n=1 Tax=Olea europaea var. sylvestris TaxID=158386 RepID=UPI000C1D2530|nr:major pollen allergen Ole e 10-like isoform X2 [Olea europaea var. sylvestris]